MQVHGGNDLHQKFHPIAQSIDEDERHRNEDTATSTMCHQHLGYCVPLGTPQVVETILPTCAMPLLPQHLAIQETMNQCRDTPDNDSLHRHTRRDFRLHW